MTDPHRKPFLKWVGGKTRSLDSIEAALPAEWNRLIEPFLGGGATFFRFGGEASLLGDVNAELINAYTVVRDDVDALVQALSEHAERYNADGISGRPGYFYEVRGLDRGLQASSLDPVPQAARMIFMNKTCVNGLYRVNKSGLFNVPHGRYANPKICDEPTLRRCSELLQGVSLRVASFIELLEAARAGDLVYLDPPYVPVSGSADFTSYTAGGFGTAEHVALLKAIRAATERGVFVMLSSSDSFGLRERYSAEGWTVHEVSVGRSVNSDTKKRGKVTELLVTNY